LCVVLHRIGLRVVNNVLVTGYLCSNGRIFPRRTQSIGNIASCMYTLTFDLLTLKINEITGLTVEHFCVKFGDHCCIGFGDILRIRRPTNSLHPATAVGVGN